MTENPTKKRDLSLLSHFSLILPSLSVEARVGSCDVLVSRRFCLAFLLFGLWDLPIRLPFFGPRPRPPLQNTPSLRLIVQSRSNPRLRLLSQKKKKKSHRSIRFNGESTPPTQSTILPSSSLSSSLRARSTSSISTIKRTLA